MSKKQQSMRDLVKATKKMTSTSRTLNLTSQTLSYKEARALAKALKFDRKLRLAIDCKPRPYSQNEFKEFLSKQSINTFDKQKA